jgi:23S rRNA (adenine-C8)-methyltransferase
MGQKIEKIKKLLEVKDQPKYRINQIIDAIYRQDDVICYSQISNISKELRDSLINELGDSIFSLREIAIQKDGETQKILFETVDGNRIETVRMHYESGRNTCCVSTQVGCAMGCAFCATGKLGIKRNLNSDEIVDQVLYFKKKGDKVDNVVFMGMGEPLVNPATFEALDIMIDQKKLGIGQRHISVSTVGVIPGIKRMTHEQPQINLALSLHSPFQDEREKIMPIARTYHIADIMSALEDHIHITGRKVVISYILLGGINDSENHAIALAEMLNSYKDIKHLFHVNLINLHEVEGIDIKRSSNKKMNVFRQILQDKGVRNTLRQDFGESIDAACGQLSGKYKN